MLQSIQVTNEAKIIQIITASNEKKLSTARDQITTAQRQTKK